MVRAPACILSFCFLMALASRSVALGEVPGRAELGLVKCGAIYRDDFNSGTPGKAPWRIWPSPKGKHSFVRFENGEFHASGAGIVWSRTADGDCVVAADISHDPATAPYSYQQVHLCAGSGGSADYSVQGVLSMDERGMSLVSEYHTEVGTEGVTRGYLRDPRDSQNGVRWADDGKLRTVLVERNAETQLGTVYAHTDDGWVQVGRPRRFPFGGLGVELKTYAAGLDQRPAVARWDNFRVYPRPASHYVCVQVVSQSGQPIRQPGLSVQLLNEKGESVVSQAGLSNGRGLLPLRNAPWTAYPVSCRLRLIRDMTICAEGDIRAENVEGLYPRDVWRMQVRWPPEQTREASTLHQTRRPTLEVVQSAEDYAQADLSFLKERTLPEFSRISRVVPPSGKSNWGFILADDFSEGKNDSTWTTSGNNVQFGNGSLRLSDGSGATAALRRYSDLVTVCELKLKDQAALAEVTLSGGPMGPAYAVTLSINGNGRAVLECVSGPSSEKTSFEAAVTHSVDLTYFVKIERVDSTGKVRCFVKGAGEWQAVGSWVSLPLLEATLVLRARQGVVFFDNVRAYPRPQVKYVFFRVSAQMTKEERAKYKGDPIHREIEIEVYTADGKRLAGKARGYHGSTHVPLDPAAWGTYPASALVKILYVGQQVGEAIPLEARGVKGLYPGSFWQITIQ